MKYFDYLKYKWNRPYSIICKGCGRSLTCITQEDAHPEYYTDVILRCECGEGVEFELPVN
jgi:lysyl-tRNA synthetase class I